MSKRKDKEEDIFDVVKKRKRDILRKESICKKKIDVEKKHQENLKDPIYRETCSEKIIASERKVGRIARMQTHRLSIVSSLTFKTFRCHVCKRVKTDPSSWIISKDKTKAVCRSCFSLCGWSFANIDLSKINQIKFINLFDREERRYKIDPLSLCRMRENLRLSVEQFAKLAGWSAIYQYKLEQGNYSTISEKTMKEICQVFSRKGFNISSNVWGDPIIYYLVEPDLIKSARKLSYLSVKEFTARAGWSIVYQYRIESGKVKKVSKSVAETIQQVLYQG